MTKSRSPKSLTQNSRAQIESSSEFKTTLFSLIKDKPSSLKAVQKVQTVIAQSEPRKTDSKPLTITESIGPKKEILNPSTLRILEENRRLARSHKERIDRVETLNRNARFFWNQSRDGSSPLLEERLNRQKNRIDDELTILRTSADLSKVDYRHVVLPKITCKHCNSVLPFSTHLSHFIQRHGYSAKLLAGSELAKNVYHDNFGSIDFESENDCICLLCGRYVVNYLIPRHFFNVHKTSVSGSTSEVQKEQIRKMLPRYTGHGLQRSVGREDIRFSDGIGSDGDGMTPRRQQDGRFISENIQDDGDDSRYQTEEGYYGFDE